MDSDAGAEAKVGDLVVAEQMWGLSPFVSTGAVKAGDHMRIEFDIASRKAFVNVGGTELLSTGN